MKDYVASLPTDPGCYLYKDKTGTILYVGKAKNLRNRVRSYFSKDVSGKTAVLMSKAVAVETIATRTETEALLLENRLINQHKPQYNIMLKENRRYAWILVTDDEFPRIITARNKRRSGTYFGPFTDGTARRQLVIALNKVFKLRTCRVLPKKVCLQYHIGNCSGPCEGHDTAQSYGERVGQALEVLNGRSTQLIKKLSSQMTNAASKQNYEQAKYYRDMIDGIKSVEQRQVVEREENHDQDVIGFARDEEDMIFVVMQVRRGVIHKKREYTVGFGDEVVEEFLTALYRNRVPPGEVIVGGLSEDRRKVLSAYLGKLVGGSVQLTIPQRGDKKKLLDLAMRNAELAVSGDNSALTSLQEKLKLAAPPQTIDCFDISTHQGSQTVGACVRYANGRPDPSKYRHFIVRGKQQDDFAAMAEVVGRRYREDNPPDLIVIDGGKGQLSAAREVLHARHPGTPIVALAKQEEEIFVPGLSFSIRMDQKDPGLLLLRRIRDATHRFVITHHRGRRRKELTASILDHIDGVGPARKKLLYDRFKTFSRIQRASLEQLQEILGAKTGENVHQRLHASSRQETTSVSASTRKTK